MTDHDAGRRPPRDRGVDPSELASLAEVMRHPEHSAGLQEFDWTVTRIEEPDPEFLVRVSGVLSGEGEAIGWDGENIAVRLEMPGVPEELADFPGAPETTSRVYTVAECEPAERQITIDFVRHGHDSPAMRWLDAARPGATLRVRGPRAHRVPGPGSPLVLLADGSALPAARSILRRRGGPALLFAAAHCEQELAGLHDAAGVDLRSVDPEEPFPLATALERVELPAEASVWAAGEREDMRSVRRRCRDLGLPRESTQVFGYWKRGVTNTSLDIDRLRAARRALEAGAPLLELDEFGDDEHGSRA